MAEIVMRIARIFASDGLATTILAGIPLIRNLVHEPIYVLLSGTSSPYNGKEVYDIPGGLWTPYEPERTFAGNLYAENGESGLNGLVVEIHRGGQDWWYFPYPRRGQTHPPPPSCTGARTCARAIDQATGGGKSGLAITVVFSNPAGTPATLSFSGTTDGDGNFCVDAPISGGVKGNPLHVTATTSLGAVLSASPVYNPVTDTCDARFNFCEVSLVAYAYDGDEADPGPDGGIAAALGTFGPGFPGYAIGQQVPDGWVAPTPDGIGIVNTGTKLTHTAQSLTSPTSSLIGTAGYLPNYVLAQNSDYYGYGGWNCEPGVCGGTIHMPIPLFLKTKYVWNAGCNPGLYSPVPTCYPFHTDPPRKLVTPKRLYATFVGPNPILGGESGVSVPLNWDPTSWDGRYDHPYALPPWLFEHDGNHIIAWISDCSASGSYGGCYDVSTLNCLSELSDFRSPYSDPILLHQVFFGSRRIVLEYNPVDSSVLRTRPQISYQNAWDGSCHGDPAPLCSGTAGQPDAIYATTFGYCNYDLECPPYSTLPPPTGPRAFYPMGLGVPLSNDVGSFVSPPFCEAVVNRSKSVIETAFFAGCDWSWSVTVTE
jgi:hypothetical protein